MDLRKAGLKETLPRLKVLAILQGEQRHLSAEEVYKSLLDSDQEVGLATVYRVLTQFEAAGIVIRHNFEGGRAVFELDDRDHHDHIVCTTCGYIQEFTDDVIETHQEQIAKKHRLAITAHSLVLYGECLIPDCPRRSA